MGATCEGRGALRRPAPHHILDPTRLPDGDLAPADRRLLRIAGQILGVDVVLVVVACIAIGVESVWITGAEVVSVT